MLNAIKYLLMFLLAHYYYECISGLVHTLV